MCYIVTEKENMDSICNRYTEYKKHIWNFNKKMSKATILWDQGTQWRITWNWVYIHKQGEGPIVAFVIIVMNIQIPQQVVSWADA